MPGLRRCGPLAAFLVAWVFWIEHKSLTMQDAERVWWDLHSAWESKAECEKVKNETSDRMLKFERERLPEMQGVAEMKFVPGSLIQRSLKGGGPQSARYICVPATIDPRGLGR
jgi:hypothetical protein